MFSSTRFPVATISYYRDVVRAIRPLTANARRLSNAILLFNGDVLLQINFNAICEF